MSITIHSDVRALRRQVVLTLLSALVVIAGLWAFVLDPLQDEIAACDEQIVNVGEELAAFQLQMDYGGIAERLVAASARNRQLVAEWEALRQRVDTFQGQDSLHETLPAYDDGRIDFKVALFNAREELLEQAKKANVMLPEDLGISDTIGSAERAELRLWHLVATVRLVQLAIEVKLPAITQIESGVPRPLALDADTTQMTMQFPTRLVVRCAFSDLVRFLDRLAREGSFFAIRKLRVERMGTHGSRMLEAEIVAGAILFQVRNGVTPPGDDAGKTEPGAGAVRPGPARSRRTRLAHTGREVRYDG